MAATQYLVDSNIQSDRLVVVLVFFLSYLFRQVVRCYRLNV